MGEDELGGAERKTGVRGRKPSGARGAAERRGERKAQRYGRAARVVVDWTADRRAMGRRTGGQAGGLAGGAQSLVAKFPTSDNERHAAHLSCSGPQASK